MSELNNGVMGPTDLDIKQINWVNDISLSMPHMIIPTRDHKKLVYLEAPNSFWDETNIITHLEVHTLDNLHQYFEPGDKVKYISFSMELSINDPNNLLQQLL